MHSSLVVLTLLSSAFAAPLPGLGDSLANIPVNVKAPIAAIADVGAKVVAPVEAKVANVNADYLNVGNDVLSGNKLIARHGDAVDAPVNVFAPAYAVADVVANAKVPVDAAVANARVENVKGLNGIASGNKIDARGGGLANLPVDVDAPVGAVAGVLAKVDAPIHAAVANVDADYLDVLNDVGSGNKVVARGDASLVDAPVGLKAPVNAVVGAAVKAVAPVKADVANVALKNVNAANVVGSGNDVVLRRGGDASLVKAPVGLDAPVKALVGVAAKLDAPIKAAVGNVNLKDVNVANDVLSGNKLNL